MCRYTPCPEPTSRFVTMSTLIKRRRRLRLRAMMRGYRSLKRSDNLGLVRRTKSTLVDTRLDDRPGSPFILGEASDHAELAARQYVLAWLGGARLYEALLFSLGSNNSAVVFPLPRPWQEVLIEYGFVVGRKRCSLAWTACVAAFWAYGMLRVGRDIGASLYPMIRRRPRPSTAYAYLNWLNASHMPKPCNDGRSHDIITWYGQWSGRAEDLEIIGHGWRGGEVAMVGGLRAEFVGDPIPALANPISVLKFLGWASYAAVRSAFDALRGYWPHAFLLGEASTAKRASLVEPDTLARDYLFHNSRPVYRPLWTYEAEARGSRILFYFYSTSEQFKLPTGYESERFAWGPMNWPTYLVWDEYQEQHVRRLVDYDPRIDIVGPIWFQTSGVELPEIPRRSVVVFDVQPFRRSTHFAFSTIGDLSCDDPKGENQFLLDVELVLRERRVTMVHKRKRDAGRRVDRKYTALVQRLSEQEGVLTMEPAISAIRVIEGCQAVISYPFTSTAILAREQGKPSIYYDPICVIRKDDRGAHGIEVVSGIDELRAWVTRELGRAEDTADRLTTENTS